MITDLLPEAVRQPVLWSKLERERRERVWKEMDKLNASLGRDTIRMLSAGSPAAGRKLQAQHRFASVDGTLGLAATGPCKVNLEPDT